MSKPKNLNWLDCLFKKIKSLNCYFDMEPGVAINSGGCAWLAGLIGENAKIGKCLLVAPTWRAHILRNDFSQARKEIPFDSLVPISKWEKNGVGFYHVIYTPDNEYCFDAECGIQPMAEYCAKRKLTIIGELSIKETMHLAAQRGHWNIRFERAFDDAHSLIADIVDEAWRTSQSTEQNEEEVIWEYACKSKKKSKVIRI